MKQRFSTTHLNLRAFAQSAGQLADNENLTRYERVARECHGGGQGALVGWSARGEMRPGHLGQEVVWLHLRADASAPMICQRCLEAVDVPLLVDRSFRFVADEETAAAQDDEAEEDLLVLQPDFNLHELLEDELVLALPLIPRHDVCPNEVPLQAVDPDFGVSVAGRPNPFAVLKRTKLEEKEEGGSAGS